MKFEIDVDGTLIDTHSAVRLLLARKGIYIDWEQAQDYQMSGFSPKIKKAVKKQFESPLIYDANISIPLPYSIECITEFINNSHEITFYTGFENLKCMCSKHEIVNRYFKPNYTYMAVEYGKKKDINADFAINDCFEDLKNRKAKHKFLIPRPYNKNAKLENTGIIRATWAEIYQYSKDNKII